MFSSGSQVLYLPGGTAARVSTGLTSPRPPAPPHPPPRTHLMAQPFHFTRYSMRPCKTHGGDAGVRPEPGGGGGGIVVAVGGSPPLPPAPGRAGPAAPRTFRMRRLMMDSAAKTRSPTADSSILCASAAAPAAHNNPARPAPPRLPPLPPPARARPRPRVTLSPPPLPQYGAGGEALKGAAAKRERGPPGKVGGAFGASLVKRSLTPKASTYLAAVREPGCERSERLLQRCQCQNAVRLPSCKAETCKTCLLQQLGPKQ